MKKENIDGICYRTKSPKMTVKEDWQIKLSIIANTDRNNFTSDKEYIDYIDKHTQYAIEEQQIRVKKAWADLNKQNVSSN